MLFLGFSHVLLVHQLVRTTSAVAFLCLVSQQNGTHTPEELLSAVFRVCSVSTKDNEQNAG